MDHIILSTLGEGWSAAWPYIETALEYSLPILQYSLWALETEAIFLGIAAFFIHAAKGRNTPIYEVPYICTLFKNGQNPKWQDLLDRYKPEEFSWSSLVIAHCRAIIMWGLVYVVLKPVIQIFADAEARRIAIHRSVDQDSAFLELKKVMRSHLDKQALPYKLLTLLHWAGAWFWIKKLWPWDTRVKPILYTRNFFGFVADALMKWRPMLKTIEAIRHRLVYYTPSFNYRVLMHSPAWFIARMDRILKGRLGLELHALQVNIDAYKEDFAADVKKALIKCIGEESSRVTLIVNDLGSRETNAELVIDEAVEDIKCLRRWLNTREYYDGKVQQYLPVLQKHPKVVTTASVARTERVQLYISECKHYRDTLDDNINLMDRDFQGKEASAQRRQEILSKELEEAAKVYQEFLAAINSILAQNRALDTRRLLKRKAGK